ncbi:MAG: hypothetical protein AAGJ81_13195 [Verrucomicrobiota bacterium]
MKTLLIFLVLVVVVIGGLWVAKREGLFSREMTLTATDGRTISVSVISHNSEEVRFARISDGKVFTFPTDELSTITRLRLLLRDDRENLEDWPVAETAGKARYSELSERLAELHRQIALLEQKKEAAETSSLRSIAEREIENVELKIEKVEYEMERRSTNLNILPTQ